MPFKNQDLSNIIEGFVELYDAAIEADYTRVRRLGGAYAKLLETLGDENAANRLKALARKKSVPLKASGYVESLPVDSKTRSSLLDELGIPDSPVFLTDSNISTVQSFLSEVTNAEKLHESGLIPQSRIMLSGPPGTGKTLLAMHIAFLLKLPIYTLRLDSVISSFLGETAKNLRNVFDFFSQGQAVLLIDEIDAVAKLRDDRYDLGELKRIVNTLIQGLDALDDKAIIIGATNHWELLDKAIWRRFSYKLFVDLPDKNTRSKMIEHYLFDDISPREIDNLATISQGLSGADIKTIAHTERKNAIIQNRQISLGNFAYLAIQYQENSGNIAIKNTLTLDDKKCLAYKLKDNFGLTQSDIARLFDFSRQAISKIMRRKADACEK